MPSYCKHTIISFSPAGGHIDNGFATHSGKSSVQTPAVPSAFGLKWFDPWLRQSSWWTDVNVGGVVEVSQLHHK